MWRFSKKERLPNLLAAQLAGIVEYTDCISTERLENKCHVYETKLSVSEALVLEFRKCVVPFIAITPRSTLIWSCRI